MSETTAYRRNTHPTPTATPNTAGTMRERPNRDTLFARAMITLFYLTDDVERVKNASHARVLPSRGVRKPATGLCGDGKYFRRMVMTLHDANSLDRHLQVKRDKLNDALVRHICFRFLAYRYFELAFRNLANALVLGSRLDAYFNVHDLIERTEKADEVGDVLVERHTERFTSAVDDR